MCVSRGKICFFLGKFGVICLYETFVLRFALLHIYRQIHDFNAINLLTRLRLNFSHLNQQKFRYNFLGTIGPVCSCGSETEATAHFLLRFQNHIISRPKLLKNIYNLGQTLRNYDNDHLIHTVHYSSEKFNFNLTKEIIKLTVQKFRYNFLGTIGPVCSCGSETEATAHFLLRFQNHIISRPKLLKNIYNLGQTLRNYDNDHLIHTVHYSSEKFNFNLTKEIIKLTVCYLKDTEQFEYHLKYLFFKIYYYYCCRYNLLMKLICTYIMFWFFKNYNRRLFSQC